MTSQARREGKKRESTPPLNVITRLRQRIISYSDREVRSNESQLKHRRVCEPNVASSSLRTSQRRIFEGIAPAPRIRSFYILRYASPTLSSSFFPFSSIQASSSLPLVVSERRGTRSRGIVRESLSGNVNACWWHSIACNAISAESEILFSGLKPRTLRTVEIGKREIAVARTNVTQ